jgi:hypothetical protein
MPKDRDFKRLVRARMDRTGERYTQARAALVKEIAAPENLQLSCLHLGFYLASWGMFRSSAVRGRSIHQFKPVVELIANTRRYVWDIDADAYSDEACAALIATASEIKETLHFPSGMWPTPTLATKIMLGVFGNVPAFDRRVVAGLKADGLVGRFGLRALRAIGGYYERNADLIEQGRLRTLDFETGQHTDRKYTRAKVVDMIFYVKGGGTAFLAHFLASAAAQMRRWWVA